MGGTQQILVFFPSLGNTEQVRRCGSLPTSWTLIDRGQVVSLCLTLSQHPQAELGTWPADMPVLSEDSGECPPPSALPQLPETQAGERAGGKCPDGRADVMLGFHWG